MRILFAALLALATLTTAAPAFAQDQTPAAEPAMVDDVIVVARRSGAPMWTVTRGDSTLILVGAICGLPHGFDWRPGGLEAAAQRAQLAATASQWAAAIEAALSSPGVTMGVAPVRLLAEEGGVLDGLKARGFEIEGPAWK